MADDSVLEKLGEMRGEVRAGMQALHERFNRLDESVEAIDLRVRSMERRGDREDGADEARERHGGWVRWALGVAIGALGFVGGIAARLHGAHP